MRKNQKKTQFSKKDNFWKNLMWQTICDLYKKKDCPGVGFTSFKRHQLEQIMNFHIVVARHTHI